ncbi:MAG: class IV adenylate cyclase [Asgard group archaeon]|nr:class IV adenylate cyclase [Asgard group archaeon]
MMFDIEIKARYEEHEKARQFLRDNNAKFHGIDNQIDIYFQVNNGRLKLRKGQIESALVFYKREDKKGVKVSEYYLYHSKDFDKLELILRESMSVLVEVKKKREMYFIDNVKFNLDEVDELGKFIEIEAITDNEADFSKLKKIVKSFIKNLEINENDIQSHSYSDLLYKTKTQLKDIFLFY